MTDLLEIPGMIRGEPNSVYHANKALSFSNLKIGSPELLKMHMDGLLPHEHKDAWDVGNAVHTAVLEPEKLGEYYFADEGFNGATKAGKAIKAEVVEKGQTLLNAANSLIYHHCVSAIAEDHAHHLFEYGEAEVTWRVDSELFGAQSRSDWICHSAPAGLERYGIEKGERYVADLKTTRSIDDWFSSVQWKNPLTSDLLYAGQCVYYTQIIDMVLSAAGQGKVDKWVFVVVEKELPFRVAVIKTTDTVLEWARNKVENALGEYVSRLKSDNWTDERLSGVYEPEIRIYDN